MTHSKINNSGGQSVKSATPGLVAKGVGALKGLAAGDSLGWPQEMRGSGRQGSRPTISFRDWVRRAGGRFYAHEETIRAGEYSDDTQLTFAVGRALLSTSEWVQCLARRELPFFQIYQRGAGRATLSAVAAWRRSIPPWEMPSESDLRGYLDAGGNGAAMRCLPHALWHAVEGRAEDVVVDVHEDSVLTHGHPRALLGAAVYAAAAHWLLKLRETLAYGSLIGELLATVSLWGKLPSKGVHGWRAAYEKFSGPIEGAWEKTVQEIVQLLKVAYEGLERGALADDQEMLGKLGCFGKWKGSATATSVAAIYLASRHAARPTAAVLAAAFATDADTDTLAAMTGGLLGALAGSHWMPSEWLQVQDAEALATLGERLLSHNRAEVQWRPLSESNIHRIVDDAEKSGAIEIDPSLGGKVLNREDLYSKGRLAAVVFKTFLHDGQTIYVKRLVSKNSRIRKDIDGDTAIGSVEVRAVAADIREAPHSRQLADHVARNKTYKRPSAAALQFNSIRIAVVNLAASRAFYVALGLRVMNDDRNEISFGSFSISTFPVDRNVSAESGALGRAVVIFDAPDLELAAERVLTAGGVEVERSSENAEEQWRRFQDLDGNMFEVYERALRQR